MFAFIPLLGPIIDGIFGIFRGQQNIALKQIEADTAEGKTLAGVTVAFKDDLGLKVLRDGLLIGPVTWTMLISWDTIVAIRYPWLMFHVAEFPQALAYLPYAAICFLLGNAWINKR